MKKETVLTLAGVGLGIVLNNYHPFIVSYPSIGGEWKVVNWTNTIFTVATVYLVIRCLIASVRPSSDLLLRLAGIGIILAILHVVFLNVYVAIRIYWLWKDSPVGRNLLPPVSGYYFTLLLRFARPYLLSFNLGLLLTGTIWLINKWARKIFIDKEEMVIIFWLCSVLGFERIFTAFSTSLLLALIFLLIRRHKAINLTPFLLLGMCIGIFFGKEVNSLVFGFS